MRGVVSLVTLIFLSCFSIPATLPAYWIWSPAEGKFVQPEGASKRSAKEQYDYVHQLREKGEEEKLVRALQDLVEQYPRSAYAPEAQFMLAVMYEDNGDYGKAAGAFQKLIRDFPRSEKIDVAMERLFRIGNFYLTGQKEKILGLAVLPVLPKAVEIFQFIAETAPYGPYGDHAQLRLGMAYQKMGKLNEAVQAFEHLIANYPDSALLEEAHYLLAETSYELSQVANRDQQSRGAAADHLDIFLSEQATGSLADRAQLLKHELDEQDAEKSYRIGLYYEKQGFMESAMIYYQDVSQRYPNTQFGKKSAEQLKRLTEPLRVLEQTAEDRARRLAEVESMIAALDRKDKEQAPEAAVTSETVQLREQLESEKTTLMLAEERWEHRTEEQYQARLKALREREKNLRTKIKTFTKRQKKMMKESPSAELVATFIRWEASLLSEQEELRKERDVLRELGTAVGGMKWPSLDWVPFVGPRKLPSADEAIEFKEKRWEKLTEARERARAERAAYEEGLAELTKQIDLAQEREFETAKALPVFRESLPGALKNREATNLIQAGQLDELRRLTQALELEYGSKYGTAALASQETSLPAVSPLNAVPINDVVLLEQKLESLRIEKASLSQAWIDQKKKVSTLASAAGQPRIPLAGEDAVPSFDSLSDTEVNREVRLVKKRLKFLEREIRSRIDQIQDWEQKNAARIDHLNQLLSPNREVSKFKGSVEKVFFPVTVAYRFGKMFLFGLGNRDRELLAEAREIVARSPRSYSSETLSQIKMLVDEIELQSMLIEGRTKEVQVLTKSLEELQTRASQIPGFTYQSMWTPRYPMSIEHSIDSARGLLGEEEQDRLYLSRLEQEQTEMSRLDRALREVDSKIETLAQAVERAQQAQKEAKALEAAGTADMSSPQLAVSLEGDAEQMPTRMEPDEQAQLASQLAQLRAELAEKEKEYGHSVESFEHDVREWYETEGKSQIAAAHSVEEGVEADMSHPATLEVEQLLEKRREVENQLFRMKEKEYELVLSQKEFLDKKLTELEERLRDLKDRSGAVRDALGREIERSGRLRESVIQELTVLKGALKK